MDPTAVIVVAETDPQKFTSRCQELVRNGYLLSSSSCGPSYGAVFVLPEHTVEHRRQEGGRGRIREAHFGDPCVFCDILHDNVAPGPCRGRLWLEGTADLRLTIDRLIELVQQQRQAKGE